MQKEFDDFEQCIRDLREFVIKNTSDWGSPNRLQLQLDHVTASDDLEELSESGKMLAKEQILTQNAADDLTRKVDHLAGKLKNLNGRNSEMIERMKNCITVLDDVGFDMQKLDAVFESVESRLNAFVRSENVETADADRITLEALLEDLNQ
ncbi:unnamed protein product [Gongylonema pulchrum]|uniref:Uncharacterized protein n=1 Tax=Gongylonema pulchrum TaxID=637853 RepID=A0A3P7N888_9BILA|nr:unnamed protein product [Gongylonema pulchrum]